jgi:hypothetical protein
VAATAPWIGSTLVRFSERIFGVMFTA